MLPYVAKMVRKPKRFLFFSQKDYSQYFYEFKKFLSGKGLRLCGYKTNYWIPWSLLLRVICRLAAFGNLLKNTESQAPQLLNQVVHMQTLLFEKHCYGGLGKQNYFKTHLDGPSRNMQGRSQRA